MPFPRIGNYTKAMVNILVTIIEKTPYGGVTMEDLKQDYAVVVSGLKVVSGLFLIADLPDKF